MSRDRVQRDQMQAQIVDLQRQVDELRAEVARLAPKPVKATAAVEKK